MTNPLTFITRLRLDAALYEPAPPRKPGQMGRQRLKGKRLPNLSVVAEDPSVRWRSVVVAEWYGAEERTVEVVSNTALWYSTGLPAVPLRWVLIRDPRQEFRTQALLCTDLGAEPERIISWFVRRWQMEATFQEVRQRLGFETQRQWSEKAIRRTAPALLGLFSLVTLFAHRQMAQEGSRTIRRAAWYDKTRPTFTDALALVRKELWTCATFRGLLSGPRHSKSPASLHGTLNGCGLLCGLMAKVQQKGLSPKFVGCIEARAEHPRPNVLEPSGTKFIPDSSPPV
jgi:hypothetical protein